MGAPPTGASPTPSYPRKVDDAMFSAIVSGGFRGGLAALTYSFFAALLFGGHELGPPGIRQVLQFLEALSAIIKPLQVFSLPAALILAGFALKSASWDSARIARRSLEASPMASSSYSRNTLGGWAGVGASVAAWSAIVAIVAWMAGQEVEAAFHSISDSGWIIGWAVLDLPLAFYAGRMPALSDGAQ